MAEIFTTTEIGRGIDGDLEEYFTNISNSIVEDYWPDSDGLMFIEGKLVAWTIFTVYLDNYQDPVHYKLWRDPKNPRKIHSENSDPTIKE